MRNRKIFTPRVADGHEKRWIHQTLKRQDLHHLVATSIAVSHRVEQILSQLLQRILLSPDIVQTPEVYDL